MQEPVLLSQLVGPRDWVFRFSSKHLYPLSHLTGQRLTLQSRDLGWGEGSVGKVPAARACRPEFGSQHVSKGCLQYNPSI